MLRTFHINRLHISETTTPDTVEVRIDQSTVTLTRKEFQELASLAIYTGYSNSIHWADPKPAVSQPLNMRPSPPSSPPPFIQEQDA